MEKEIKKINRLSERLKKENVGLIYLFGSEVQGTSTPRSDVDLGVVFTTTDFFRDSQKCLEVYVFLYDLLSDFFPEREIDLVFLQRSPLSLQFEAVTRGKVLYEISPLFRADYTERVIKKYVDFKPLLEKFNQATLEAFL